MRPCAYCGDPILAGARSLHEECAAEIEDEVEAMIDSEKQKEEDLDDDRRSRRNSRQVFP